MSQNNRRVGRECALKVLFATKLVEGSDAARLLGEFWAGFRFSDDVLGEPLENLDKPVPAAARAFAEMLVAGVVEFRPVLDRTIREVAKNWSLERMAPVDLTILRIGTYELLYQPDIPARVTLNEAIEIAKRYGTKESPSFVNGLLDKIAKNCNKADAAS
ncbi:MAG: transcription antitermination factor NusB [Desulfuromonadales bacterium]|jgi:N utilization substance protein B|nr:transcription antitermination factor NusB [Desulfuromonadales bacterium]